MTDVSQISVVLDSQQAANDQQALRQNIQRTIDSYKGIENSARSAAAAQISAGDRYLASLQTQVDKLGKTRAEYAAFKAEQLGVATKAQPMIDALKKAEEQITKVGHSSGAARKEMIVLAHEAATGQWKNFGGSLLVLGEQTDAIGKSFEYLKGLPAGLTIGLSALAVGAAVVGTAFYQASHEMHELNTAMLLTNNYANMNSRDLRAMASGIQSFTGGSIRDAKDAALELGKTGQFTNAQIGELGPVVANFAKISGQEMGKVVQEFSRMALEPYKTAQAFDNSMHILTAGQLEHIRTLDEQGQKTQAMKILVDALQKRNVELTASIQAQKGAWDTLGEGMSGAWDKFKNWLTGGGQQKDEIKALEGQLVSLASSGALRKLMGFDTSEIEGKMSGIKKLIETLKAAKAEEEKQTKNPDAGGTNSEFLELQNKGKIAMGYIGQYVDATVKLEEKIAVFQQNWKKAQEANKAAAQRGIEGINPQLSDTNYQKALQAFIERNKNPMDEAASKNAYLNKLSDFDEYIKNAQQQYQYYNAMVQTQVMSGLKTQQQALDEEHKLKHDDIAVEIDYTEKKLAAARERAKAHPLDTEAANQVREFTRALSVLRGQDQINDAQWTAQKAKFAKEVSSIYENLLLQEKKWSDAQARTFNSQTNKEFMTSNESAKADEDAARIDHYREARDKLLQDYKNKSMTGSAEELKALSDLAAMEENEKNAAKDRWDARLAAQQDWRNGASVAFRQYAEDAQNSAKTANNAVKNILSGTEDAMTELIAHQKLDWRSWADMVNVQMARVASQKLVSAGADLASSFFTAKADGGFVQAGSDVWVGEQGPERVSFKQDAYVTPAKNMKSNSSGGFTFNGGNVTVQGGSGNVGAMQAELQRALDQRDAQMVAWIMNEMRAGGMLAK